MHEKKKMEKMPALIADQAKFRRPIIFKNTRAIAIGAMNLIRNIRTGSILPFSTPSLVNSDLTLFLPIAKPINQEAKRPMGLSHRYSMLLYLPVTNTINRPPSRPSNTEVTRKLFSN